MADGCVRLLPVSWTSLCPPGVAEFEGKPVLLALVPLRTLAKWVSTRRAGSSTCDPKLGHFDERGDNVVPDGAPRKGIPGKTAPGGRNRSGAGAGRGRRTTTAVVEQVGSPCSRGGSGRRRAQRKRGWR